MKLVIIADAHVHPWRLQSRDGGHDRLLDSLSAVEQSLDLALAEDAIWVSAGDMKQPKTNWPQEALTGLHALLRNPKYATVPKVLLEGNHDGTGIGGSGLAPFADCSMVIESPCVITPAEDVELLCAPWDADLVDVKMLVEANPGVPLIGHGFLQGCLLGPEDIRIAKGIALSDFGNFPVAFFGDVHKAQYRRLALNRPPEWIALEIGKTIGFSHGEVFYAGSPYQQNWGERGDDKGVLLVDFDRAEVTLMSINAPRYQHFEFDERGIVHFIDPKVSDPLKKDFVRIVYTGKPHDALDDLREMADEFRSFQLIPRRPPIATSRTEVHAAMEMPELLQRYMEARPPEEGLDPLKTLGALIRLAEEPV